MTIPLFRRAPRALLGAFAAFLVLGVTGCPDDVPDPVRVDTCAGGEPPLDGKETVILGTTQVETFVPLKPGDPVVLIHGPQGGQHIHVSTKLFAVTKGQWQHIFGFVDDAGMEAGSSRDLMEACKATGWTVSHNIRVYIDDPSLEKGTVTLEMFPTENEESTVKAEMEITLTD